MLDGVLATLASWPKIHALCFQVLQHSEAFCTYIGKLLLSLCTDRCIKLDLQRKHKHRQLLEHSMTLGSYLNRCWLMWFDIN